MSAQLPDLSVSAFLDAVAARTPAPAAGAVAAVTIGAAASLVAMAARFTDDEIAEVADRLRGDVLPLAEADGEAYGAVLDAYRLPRAEPGRQEQITQAMEHATDIPLRIARTGAEVAELAARLAREGNPRLVGDATAAALMAEGATKAAANLVEVNQVQGPLPESWLHEARKYTRAAEAATRTARRNDSPE
jgi:methenyltetrahydrofolate cyclohydrolase